MTVPETAAPVPAEPEAPEAPRSRLVPDCTREGCRHLWVLHGLNGASGPCHADAGRCPCAGYEPPAAPAEPLPGPSPNPHPGDGYPDLGDRYARIEASALAKVAGWHADARANVFDGPPSAVPAMLTLPDLPAPVTVPVRVRATRLAPLTEEERQVRGRHARPRKGEDFTDDGPGPASQEQAAEAQGWTGAGRDADFSPPPTPGPSRDHAGIWLPPEQVRPGGPMSRPLPVDLDEEGERHMGRFLNAHAEQDARDGDTRAMTAILPEGEQ